jgi:mannose-6-phosphate isomerase-like protein (cupin superfamily)
MIQYFLAATTFPFKTNLSNVASIPLTTRYPAEGFALNNVAEMTVYILEGTVLFHQEGDEVTLAKGDAVLVETNKKYFWEPKPQTTLLIFSTPPWTPEQSKTIK